MYKERQTISLLFSVSTVCREFLWGVLIFETGRNPLQMNRGDSFLLLQMCLGSALCVPTGAHEATRSAEHVLLSSLKGWYCIVCLENGLLQPCVALLSCYTCQTLLLFHRSHQPPLLICCCRQQINASHVKAKRVIIVIHNPNKASPIIHFVQLYSKVD